MIAPKTFFRVRKQCKACPFRDTAIKGYFGGHDPKTYLDAALHENAVPCHMTAHRPMKERHQCTGMALFRNKICKEPRDRVAVEHQDRCVEKYGTGGILSYQEFITRHLRGLFGGLLAEDNTTKKGSSK